MLIAPLLVESMDRSMRVQIRHRIARQAHCSERTIRRYEQAYRKEGFNGLKPRSRDNHRSRKLPENFDELLQEAIQLKREVPRRSVEQIIFILEGEGKSRTWEIKTFNASEAPLRCGIWAASDAEIHGKQENFLQALL